MLCYILSLFLLLCTVSSPSRCSAAVADGISLCLTSAVPSLFPFFVTSQMAVRCGLCGALSRRLAPLLARLGLPSCAASAFLLSIVGGYPVGAQTVQSLADRGLCAASDLPRLMRFCNNTGPAFLVGMCGGGIFHSVRIGLFLYGTHVLAAVLLLLTTFGPPQTAVPPEAEEAEPFFAAFTASVTAAGQACLRVCGFILCFSVLIRLAEPLLGGLHGIAAPLAVGGLELTAGLSLLAQTPLGIPAKLCLCAGLCAFGGLSVLFQCSAAAPDCPFWKIFVDKLAHCGISVLLTLLFAPFVVG